MTTSSLSNTGSDVESSGGPKLLTFSLGDQLFALNIELIREIIQYGQMTTVPMMPTYVRGVINLRGAVVPIIDLKNRLGLNGPSNDQRACVVILDLPSEGETSRVGLLVDAVSEVVEFRAEDLEAAPQFGAPVKRDYISGVGRLGERFVLVIDPARALRFEELLEPTE
jgi:purine-binding chemotaxis protein CheW